MTYTGGAYNYGAIIEYDPATNIQTKIIDFNGYYNGKNPEGSLTMSGGKLYGMTNLGGAYGYGVIFEWDPVTNIYTNKIDFDYTNGGYTYGSLTPGGGILYGMTSSGGAIGGGVIFEWDPATNIYTKKIDFDYSTTGGFPQGSLTLSGGKFYGMTNSGGVNGYGVIFEWDPATNTYTKKYDFSLTNGSSPYGSLTLSGGKFYGLTYSGGTYGKGVIFEWDPATNTYTKKFDFNGTNGSNPNFTTLLEYTLPDTWTGAINSDWGTAGNWNTGEIPTSSLNVLIPNVTNKRPCNRLRHIGGIIRPFD